MIDYGPLRHSVYQGQARDVEQLVRERLAEGRPAHEVLQDGLIAAMQVVGEDFKNSVLYVPEVLVAARAMKAGLAILKPQLAASGGGAAPCGTLVIGTVRGDLHDIGKNLVAMMAEGAGFAVHDIGVDQSADKFLAAAERHQPGVVALSSLLTTTMTYMGTVVERFQAAGMGHVKIVVGGAPVTQGFADQIGADGYGSNAADAVAVFKRVIAGNTASA